MLGGIHHAAAHGAVLLDPGHHDPHLAHCAPRGGSRAKTGTPTWACGALRRGWRTAAAWHRAGGLSGAGCGRVPLGGARLAGRTPKVAVAARPWPGRLALTLVPGGADACSGDGAAVALALPANSASQ